MWNFFRLENEHLNNCGQFRAVRDISIAPINSNDQALLQQMMDEENGVTHRRTGSTWARYIAIAAARLVVIVVVVVVVVVVVLVVVVVVLCVVLVVCCSSSSSSSCCCFGCSFSC